MAASAGVILPAAAFAENVHLGDVRIIAAYHNQREVRTERHVDERRIEGERHSYGPRRDFRRPIVYENCR